MSEIKAAGFVLFRRAADRNLYLTLTNARHGDVGVPKGKANECEDPLETALRETMEETGIAREAIVPNRWFRRTVRYPVEKGLKEVTYLGASTEAETVRLSNEHASGAWLDLDDATAAVPHASLRGVLLDAAAFLKDPILREGMTAEDARALLAVRVDSGVVAHTEQVAAMALALAESLDVDAAFVEASAWLHDIGRAIDHARHPLEGFRLLVEEGYAGYAPSCISHYTKGRPHERCGPLADELWEACDLSTFVLEERVVALADSMAAKEQRVTIDARYEDLRERYGRSEFLDESLAISHALKAEWEQSTGRDLYRYLGIQS